VKQETKKEKRETWIYIATAILFVIGAISMLVYSFGGIGWLFPVGMVIAAIAGTMIVAMHVMQKRKAVSK